MPDEEETSPLAAATHKTKIPGFAHDSMSVRSILTILEVVVSICWVAISIDMMEVTEGGSSPSSLLLSTEKSSG